MFRLDTPEHLINDVVVVGLTDDALDLRPDVDHALLQVFVRDGALDDLIHQIGVVGSRRCHLLRNDLGGGLVGAHVVELPHHHSHQHKSIYFNARNHYIRKTLFMFVGGASHHSHQEQCISVVYSYSSFLIVMAYEVCHEVPTNNDGGFQETLDLEARHRQKLLHEGSLAGRSNSERLFWHDVGVVIIGTLVVQLIVIHFLI